MKKKDNVFTGYNYKCSNFIDHLKTITLQRSVSKCFEQLFQSWGYEDAATSRRINGTEIWSSEIKNMIRSQGFNSFFKYLSRKELETFNIKAKLSELQSTFEEGNVKNIDEKFLSQTEAKYARETNSLLKVLLSMTKKNEEQSIKYYAFGLYAVLWYFVTNGTDCLNLPSDLEDCANSKIPMTQSLFFEKLKRCLEKAEIDAFSVSEDEDQLSDIYFKDGRLIISGNVETPYFIHDICEIKYCDAYHFDGENAVIIDFTNGERLELLEYGDYDASFSRFSHFIYHVPSTKLFREYKLKVKAQKQGKDKDAFVVIDNCLIQYNGTDNEIILPEGITCIESGVFEHSSIEKVVFPSSLKIVSDYSFRHCNELQIVVLNNGLEKIGDRAFCACERLCNIVLPQTLKEISSFAFYGTGVKTFSFVPQDCKVANDVFGL